MGAREVDGVFVSTIVESDAALRVQRYIDSNNSDFTTNDKVRAVTPGAVFLSAESNADEGTGFFASPTPVVVVGDRNGMQTAWDQELPSGGGLEANGDVAAILRWNLGAGRHRLDQLVITRDVRNDGDAHFAALQDRAAALQRTTYRVARVWDLGPP